MGNRLLTGGAALRATAVLVKRAEAGDASRERGERSGERSGERGQDRAGSLELTVTDGGDGSFSIGWYSAGAHTMHAFAYLNAFNALIEACIVCGAGSPRCGHAAFWPPRAGSRTR